jgi:hypothetical protein
MTTPAPAAAAAPTDLTPAINKVIAAGAPPRPPADADMIEAMFRALGCLVPGAIQGDHANREADTIAQLAHYGAADADLGVISAWLATRQEASP